MNLYVADTHALFWYFIASPLLGAQAQAAFDEGKQGQALIYIPAIVLAELHFLNEKKQRPIDYRQRANGWRATAFIRKQPRSTSLRRNITSIMLRLWSPQLLSQKLK